MNFSDLLTLEASALAELALILTPELRDELVAVQSALPRRPTIARPIALADGRFMLSAVLLTEVGPGGLYHAGFSQLAPDSLAQVKVVPMPDAIALLPPPPEDEP